MGFVDYDDTSVDYVTIGASIDIGIHVLSFWVNGVT